MVIDAKLRLVAPIGRGAMGVLWRADHLEFGKAVAVKFMVSSNVGTRARQRFEDEASKLASIKSPHVVRVHGTGVIQEHYPFIVMELLEGESLKDYLRRVTTPPLDVVVRIVTQLADGLRSAHRAGIVHRDLKPGNVFLVPTGSGDTKAKIFDFGLAKWLGGSQITRTGALLGTPYYMSREQVMDPASVDHRADLWSLAVLAYEMLTGERPFAGSHPGAIFDAISAGVHTPPSELRPGLTEDVDVFFLRALESEPERRFSDAGAFARAFTRAMTGVNRLSADIWPVGGPGGKEAPVSGPVGEDDLIDPLGASRLEEPNDDVG